MLRDLFGVLKDALADHIRLATKTSMGESKPDEVIFLDWKGEKPHDYRTGVTLVLLNLEEDRKALPADPYRRMSADGKTMLQVNPPVLFNVSILVVAKLGSYSDSLRYLDFVVRFFQKYRAMDTSTMPSLVGKNIDKILCELISLPMSELHHIWGPLATSYIPSLVYRLRVVSYQDLEPLPAAAAPKGVEVMAAPIPDDGGKIRWAYYCLTNLADFADLRIIDTASTNPLEFELGTNLTTSADAADRLGASLVTRNPKDTVLRFVSKTMIPVDAAPRQTITLQRHKKAANQTVTKEELAKLLVSPTAEGSSQITYTGTKTPVWTSTVEYRPTRWAYYCVTNLANAAKLLKIVESAAAGNLAVSAPRDLVATPDTVDTYGAYLIARYPGETVLRFVSTTARIPSDTYGDKLELRQMKSDKANETKFEVIRKPLPNPDPNALSTLMHKFSTDTADTQYNVLTSLIEYRP